MRDNMIRTPEGYMKMFDFLDKSFAGLLPKDKDTLGWEEMKAMQ